MASQRSIYRALVVLAGLTLCCPVFPSTRAEGGLSHTLYLQNPRGSPAGFEALAHLSFLHPVGALDIPRIPDQRLFEGNQGGNGGADGGGRG